MTNSIVFRPQLEPSTAVNFRIVHPGSDHLPQLAHLFDRYRQFYGKPADLSGATEFLRQRMLQGQSTVLLSLTADNEGAGFTQLYPSFSSTQMAPILILNDLYVDAGWRRHGVGRALMEAAAQYARGVGARNLQLETAADNHPAQRLYESLGWQRSGYYHYGLDCAQH